MERKNYKFTSTTEWSDWSENSPQTRGSLPDYVVIDGKQVNCDTETIQVAQYNAEAPDWVKLSQNVSARTHAWGDDGSRRMGCSGRTIEILAPEDATFLYIHQCSACGNELRISSDEPDLDELCEDCQNIVDEQEREAEAYREEYQKYVEAERER